MKTFLTLLLLFIFVTAPAQEQLNDYKYIIVPKQFDSFKEQNQYQTSTLAKFFLDNQGFNVVYDDALPNDLSTNRCLGLLVELVNNSSLFTTKTAVAFKDCNSKQVYITQEGSSKIKEFKGSYNEAIKEALSSLKDFNYVYNQASTEPITVSFKNDVKNLPTNVPQTVADINAPAEVSNSRTMPDNESVVAQKPQAVAIENIKVSKGVYYAQAIENGYQLVDSSPKIVMKMFTTSKPNIYLGEDTNGNSGLVYSENGAWFFEYYQGNQFMKNNLQIKF